MENVITNSTKKNDVETIWNEVSTRLLLETDESYHPWIRSCYPTGFDGGTFTVITDMPMAVNIIRRSCLKDIRDLFKKVTGKDVNFEISVDKETIAKIKKELAKKPKLKIMTMSPDGVPKTCKTSEANEFVVRMQSTGLNLKYKFNSFVVGDNSRTAFSVAKLVAEHPAEKYNPLFIYGGSGLGKTHLMQAIGQYNIFNKVGKKIKYIKTHDFIDQYINSVLGKDKKEKMTKFRQRFRNIDILLIDDIQFIESTKSFKDELFYIFEVLQQMNKQIVITSDRLPKDIPTLPDRLRTRFEMGIVVDIKPPSFETRKDILKQWANDLRLELKTDVIEYIAQHFDNNVRELEGAFNKVTAIADIENVEIDLEFVKKILMIDTKMKKITIESIAQTVAEYFDVTIENLKSPARAHDISEARKYIIYLAREMTNLSYKDIAEFLNKKHPTMLYSYEKMAEESETNDKVKGIIRELRQAIKCNV